MQQIIVSGIGGQGVLFVTKLLAETALDLGCSVLISETHGMAQRGGNVISHLKVCGPIRESGRGSPVEAGSGRNLTFTSPLIRPGHADIILVLHEDGLAAHSHFQKEGGKTFCNRPHPSDSTSIDASRLAADLGSPVSANLVLLGFAVSSGDFFCGPDQIEAVLSRTGGKRHEINLRAFRVGCLRGASS